MFLRSWNKKNHNLLAFGGSHESRFHGFTSTPVPHERAMSESDTRHHGGFHQRIGMEMNRLYQNILISWPRGHET